MPVGSKWELTIPQELAFHGASVGPGHLFRHSAPSVFEVELLKFCMLGFAG
ncbi:hypothetical protein KCP77_23730 [Salmonella enterica subsp. enterica]|nr:hypothetical protein KCP77_23730 [Salmonella enterica subsp. enterica]